MQGTSRVVEGAVQNRRSPLKRQALNVRLAYARLQVHHGTRDHRQWTAEGVSGPV